MCFEGFAGCLAYLSVISVGFGGVCVARCLVFKVLLLMSIVCRFPGVGAPVSLACSDSAVDVEGGSTTRW